MAPLGKFPDVPVNFGLVAFDVLAHPLKENPLFVGTVLSQLTYIDDEDVLQSDTRGEGTPLPPLALNDT